MSTPVSLELGVAMQTCSTNTSGSESVETLAKEAESLRAKIESERQKLNDISSKSGIS